MKPYLYGIYGLPPSYADVTYKETDLIPIKQLDLAKKIANAPNKGTLTIQGSAAAVVNQLIEDRKIRGIDFLDRDNAAFEAFDNPSADVVVLYNVGSEVSLKGTVPGMVLGKIVKHYSNRKTLLIIETKYTKAKLLERYDFAATNFIKILLKPEKAWL